MYCRIHAIEGKKVSQSTLLKVTAACCPFNAWSATVLCFFFYKLYPSLLSLENIIVTVVHVVYRWISVLLLDSNSLSFLEKSL